MGNKLNGTSQIWADGYSFMEVTETLLTAMGINMDEQQPPQTDASRVESTFLTSDLQSMMGLTEPNRV